MDESIPLDSGTSFPFEIGCAHLFDGRVNIGIEDRVHEDKKNGNQEVPELVKQEEDPLEVAQGLKCICKCTVIDWHIAYIGANIFNYINFVFRSGICVTVQTDMALLNC